MPNWPIDPALVERFWARVSRDGPEVRPGLGPCWLWIGRDGRPARWYSRVQWWPGEPRRMVHRLALELSLGRPLRPGMWALHRCDNPPCANPAHLFEGSARENNRDTTRKGRHPRTGRLTADVVREIRRRYVPVHGWRARGDPKNGLTALAEEFGVTPATIRRVVLRTLWGDVPDDEHA
jgi:hypothetical protein